MLLTGIYESGFGSATRALAEQKGPLHRHGVPGADRWHDGTINIRLQQVVKVIAPDHAIVRRVHDARGRLALSLLTLVRCRLVHAAFETDEAFLYRWDPSAHPLNVLEVACPLQTGLVHGDTVQLLVRDGALRLIASVQG